MKLFKAIRQLFCKHTHTLEARQKKGSWVQVNTECQDCGATSETLR